jgi:ketoreductase RED2
MTAPGSLSWFEGKVALVTGSTTGIGEAVARRLSAVGAGVVVNSVSSREAGEQLAAELGNAHYVAADVADEEAAGRLVEEAVARFGRLDILVNNAGITRRIPLADLEAATAAVWREILDTNLVGAWNVTRAAAPHLRLSGEAAVVNLTSLVAHRFFGSSIPYAVSKAALAHLTQILARVLGPEIRVNAVSPGFVSTRWNEAQAERRAYVESHAPLRRVASPEEIAEVVLQLCRPSFITGVDVRVDGGMGLIT